MAAWRSHVVLLVEARVFGVMLICVGILLVASTAVVAVRHRRVASSARHVLAVAATPVAKIPDGSIVRIDGTARPSERGTIVAPCSGNEVLWFRLRLRDLLGATGGSGQGGGGQVWRTKVDEEDGVPLAIDDRSGVSAIISPTHVVRGTPRVYAALTPDVAERVRAFLAARGQECWLADEYEEETLAPGAEVCALGLCHHEAGFPVPAHYRDATSTRVVLEAPPNGEVVLATREGLRRERNALIGVRVVVGVGVLAVVIGSLLRWIAPD